MNWADWVILAIVALSCLLSIKRGFIREALSLATWVAALVISLLFAESLAYLLRHSIETPSVRWLVAFAVLFALTLVVGALVNHLLGELVRITGLSGTDRLFGMLFGLLRGLVVVMALLILLPEVMPVEQDPWWQDSVLIPRFLVFEDWARRTAHELTDWVIGIF